MNQLRNNHFTVPATGVHEQVSDNGQGIGDRKTDSLSPEEGLVNNVEQVASSTNSLTRSMIGMWSILKLVMEVSGQE